MKSRRFTKDMKDRMIGLISKKAFGDRFNEMAEKRILFADTCYNERYDSNARTAMTEFLYANNAFQWSLYITCHFGGRCGHSMPMSSSKPFWNDDLDSKCKFAFDHHITEMFLKLNEEENALKAERTELRQEIGSVIRAVTTTKQLLEVWPECEEWLIKVMPKEVVPVPMKHPDALNEKLCGLIGKESPTCV